MSISKEITIATAKVELENCHMYGNKFGWIFSEFDEINLNITVQMTSPVDNEVYIIDLGLENYPEWPPLIEFIHPVTLERGVSKAYPKGKNQASLFHAKPCICNPCSRQAYGGYKSVHPEWQLNSWKQNPQVGTLTTLSAILNAIYFRINNADLYAGRME